MINILKMALLFSFASIAQSNFNIPDSLSQNWQESNFFTSSIKVYQSKEADVLMVGVPRNISYEFYQSSLENGFKKTFKQQWNQRLKTRGYDKIKINYWNLEISQNQFSGWIDYQYEEKSKTVFVTEYHKITKKNWFELSLFKNSSQANKNWSFDKSKQLLSQVQIQ